MTSGRIRHARLLWAAAVSGLAACGGGLHESLGDSSATTAADATVVRDPDSAQAEGADEASAMQRLRALSPSGSLTPLPDPTNKYADNPAAAALGKKFFFDARFSGPLLDSSNNGTGGSLGMQGQAGKVACASCHVPESGFLDSRSPRQQISLGAGWTPRRAPSLLNTGGARLLMWDGRRDTAYNQIFGPLESPLEFNSSRLFLAQQVVALYKAEYEAVFGPLPTLEKYPALTPEEAGCSELPADARHVGCEKPYDDAVTRVAVNFGKAIQAYERTISCGTGRFDRWVQGDASALTEQEQRGANLFVGKAACDRCHSGPYLSDERFHVVGVQPAMVALFFTDRDDPGASEGIAAARTDPLNSKGVFSDGTDDRLDRFPADTSSLLGAFRTPSLRCVTRRPSFMHTGQYRSLADVVAFFARGGSQGGFLGVKDNDPRDLSADEIDALVAFMGALDGSGPSAEAVTPPTLP